MGKALNIIPIRLQKLINYYPFVYCQTKQQKIFDFQKNIEPRENTKINKYFLTAIYCHPLLTRTKSASSSIMYAMVPTGLKADIFKQNEKKMFKKKKNSRKNNRLLMNSHLYPGITQVFRDALQINKFSCGYLAINFNRFSIFFFSLVFPYIKTIHQFNGKSNI